ncbi:RpiB/LacA/LacB family sugar-phosphate isomerase [Ponticoccus litoralis]|uniref:RpiB/LacA/LacB family sugar-phosphate isomerase n=1 Tax=Ponticoccus litoralis TaxID=422297 RepID=A0AAW9SS99_9RHOB
MKIVIGSDHAGFPMKAGVIETIRAEGHEVTDVGSFNPEPVDFPDVARALCDKILKGEAERGLLVCGTGVGAVIAANKVPGIRASVCHDAHSAHQCVEHDDVNVMCIGAQIIGPLAGGGSGALFPDRRVLDRPRLPAPGRETERDGSGARLTRRGTAHRASCARWGLSSRIRSQGVLLQAGDRETDGKQRHRGLQPILRSGGEGRAARAGDNGGAGRSCRPRRQIHSAPWNVHVRGVRAYRRP